MKPALLILAMAISFLMNSLSWAQSESTTKVDVAPGYGENGVAFSIAGDPGLSVIGVNYLHSLSDVTRFRAGFGTLFDFGWTLGAGIDYRFLPTSRFRPVVGLEVDLTRYRDRDWEFVEDSSEPWGFGFRERNSIYNILYATLKVGFEYQAPSGFLVGLTEMGLCGVATETSGGGCAFNPFPSLRIGTMF